MEPHPVPQNILDVEFKLFGSFTLKQFSKLLLGCIVALILYFVNLNPVIKLPLMAVSVLVGIGLAIVPNFGVWLGGYVKALFISPRYVWVKEDNTPELLKRKVQLKTDKTQNVSKSKTDRKVDLSEISLTQLFGERPTKGSMTSTPKTKVVEDYSDAPNKTRETNLDQLYENVYKSAAEKRQTTKTQTSNVDQQIANSESQIALNQKSNVQNPPSNIQNPISNSQPEINNNESALLTPQDYQNKINQLKTQLSGLVKDQNYKQNESAILEEINDLYQELKSVETPNPPAQTFPETGTVTNMQGASQMPGQIVFGIIVDQNDNLVNQGRVIFRNLTTGTEYDATVTKDGRFSTDKQLDQGNYEVTIDHPNYKFHRYNIKIANQKLPAYKFRAR